MALYKGNKRYALSTNNPGNVIPLEVTKDGVYTAPTGVSGYSPVTMKNNNPYINFGNHTDANGVWHRPEEWDDIESIDLTNKHEVYFLCACHRTEHDWFRIRFYGTGTLSWSYGHVSNGVYTLHASSTETTVSSGSYISLYLANFQDDYIVVRIKSTTGITSCLYQNWVATSDLNYAAYFRSQSVLMRYGRMPKGTSLQQSSTYCLESDNIIDFAKDYQNTTTTISINGAYINAVSLQRWRCTGWDLSKNKVTSYYQLFDACCCLCDVPNPLNLDGWVTSNTTTVQYMFRNCRSMNTSITVRNWDLTNLTSFGSTFEKCMSVKHITGLETWNSAPKCTTIGYMFDNCSNLSGTIDLSNLYLGNGTANFTGIAYAFNGCYKIQQINISNVNLSKCTNISYMMHATNSCKKLIINNITPITSACTNCNYFLDYSGTEEMIFDEWDFSGHTTNLFQGGFQYSMGLKKLVFKNCTAPSVDIADTYGVCFCRYSYNLTYLDVSFLDMSVFTKTATHAQSFRDLWNLVDFYPPKNISQSFNLTDDINLSHDSLMRVINNLVTVSTTQTLTIGAYNLWKLTSEEKAIATNKGWTLA